MWRNVRSFAVVLAVILGLVAQGVGLPARALSAVQSDCAMPHGKCPGADRMGQLAPQACQAPCLSPAALQVPNTTAAPPVWARHRFAANPESLPPGLDPAPDPFPPRPLPLA